MNEKAIALAKKLKALAERGIGGEAENAATLLERLLAKHNIQLEQVETEERHRCEYTIKQKHQSLFWAIVFNVICDFDGKYRSSGKTNIVLNLTYAEQLEITAKFDFYVRNYDKQIKKFMMAFIVKHALYPNKSEETHVDRSKLSPKQKADLYETFMLSEGITRNDFQKRIEDNNI
jgi:hypothetical protein